MMDNEKINEKREERLTVGSYNEFMRHFFPDGEKAERYAQTVETTQFTSNLRPAK